MISPHNLTDQAKDLLTIHLIRSPEVMERASYRLDPQKDWDPQDFHHRVIWQCVLNYFKKTGKVIPRETLLTEVHSTYSMMQQADHPDYATYVQANELLELAWEIDLSDPAYVIETLLTPLLEKRILKEISGLSQTIAKSSIQAAVARLNETVNGATVHITEEANICDRSKMESTPEAKPKRCGDPLLDRMLGGIREAHFTGILAWTGGGKSTAGIQIALNAAQSGFQSYFFSWEMPVASPPKVRHRMWSCLTDIESATFDNYGGSQLPKDIAEKLDPALARISGKFHAFDLSHGPDSRKGFLIVKEMLRKHILRFGKPDLIVLDWLGNAAAKCAANAEFKDLDERALHEVLTNQARDIATEFRAEVVLTHQTAPAKATNKLGKMPEVGDAQAFKAFAQLMDTCFAFGKRDRFGTCLCKTLKNRGPFTSFFVRIHEAICKVEVLPQHHEESRLNGHEFFWEAQTLATLAEKLL